MKAIPFILYGGDTCLEGTALGPESLRRIEATVEIIRENKSQVSYILVGPGKRPDEPDFMELKFLMASKLKKCPDLPPTVTTTEDGWGTFKETLSLYEELKSRNEDEVFVCSSWYHVPRIKFIWWIIAGNSIQIHAVKIPSPQWKSVFTEILSFIKVFYDWSQWARTR